MHHRGLQRSSELARVAVIGACLLTAVALGSGDSTGESPFDTHYRAGLGFLERGLPDMALPELEACVARLDAEDSGATGSRALEARYTYAVCLSRLGRAADASRQLRRLDAECARSAGVAATFAFRDDATLLWAQTELAADEVDHAIEILARFDAGAPTAVAERGAVLRAELLLRRDRATDAAALMRAFISQHPQSASLDRATLIEGCALATIGDDAGAARALGTLLGRAPDGPLAPSATVTQAKCLLRLGRAKEALALLASEPAECGASAIERAYWSALCERRLGNSDAAADRLERALATRPADADPALVVEMAAERALNLALSGRLDDAARARNDLAGLAPEHSMLGTVDLLCADRHFDTGAFAEAASEYALAARAIEDPTVQATIALKRGLALARLGEWTEARPLLATATGPDASERLGAPLVAACLRILSDRALSDGDWVELETLSRALLPVLEGEPDAGDAALRLATSLRRQGRDADAIPLLASLAEDATPSAVRAHASFELADALRALARHEESQRAFESLADRDDEFSRAFRVRALRALAAIASSDGRTDESERYLAAAIEFERATAAGPDGNPIDPDLALDRAAVLLSLARYGEAESALARVLRDAPEHPRAGEAHLRRGIALARMGRAEDALAELSVLDEGTSDARAAVPDPTLISAATLERALALAATGHARDALHQLETLREAPPAIAASAAFERIRLRMEGSPSDATFADVLPELDACARSLNAVSDLERAPLERQLHFLRGVALARGGDPSAAIAELDAFVSAAADTPAVESARRLRAECLLAADRPNEATDALASLVGAAPADPATDAPHADLLLLLGDAAARAERWKDSESAYARFLAAAPDSDRWFLARFGEGWAREQSGDFDRAIASYRAVVDRHQGPTAARARFQIGECLFALGRLDDAAAEYLRVDMLHAEPQWSAAALYEAGRAFALLGRPADARRQLDAVVERFGTSTWATLARKELEQLDRRDEPDPLPGRARSRHDSAATKGL